MRERGAVMARNTKVRGPRSKDHRRQGVGYFAGLCATITITAMSGCGLMDSDNVAEVQRAELAGTWQDAQGDSVTINDDGTFTAENLKG
ncbi:DUF6287 domain-containing protein [Streptomyces sp. NBC_00347]|uniref:DUF6287 domain-containing protein n=1 Tax=Streptomyces sp. NBC_00347 TaxID=2975721 RepID=UPI00338F32AB